MRFPECGARGYSREAKAPEWRCSECGHEWARKPGPSGSSRSSFDRSPTTWSLVVDASLICGHHVYGQGGKPDAWAPPGGVGRRFRHFYSCGGTARRGHLHNLGNNCAVGWAYFRYVRQTAGAPDRAFTDGLGSFGFRSGVELRFTTGPTAHHRHRIRNDSPDHHGGVGRQLTA